MQAIVCQKCESQPRNERGTVEGGCSRCGGYGVVLRETRLACCGRTVWMRPGVHTLYEGKTYDTFDGLELTWLGGKSRCPACAEAHLRDSAVKAQHG